MYEYTLIIFVAGAPGTPSTIRPHNQRNYRKSPSESHDQHRNA